jgi:aromatic ring-opening dioxygenase catalytic subunit (LigB family)
MASVFITHGGGPMPLIYKEEHALLYQQFQGIQQQFPQPKAILLFSAHWEEQEWTILDHDAPPLYYDYYGFPAETYNLTYPIRSSPELRAHVKAELKQQGVALRSETKRGYDHGVFVPLMIMYPKADVPVIQISVLKSLSPEAHFRMGVALRGLRSQGFLVVGSGASVHGGFGQKESI